MNYPTELAGFGLVDFRVELKDPALLGQDTASGDTAPEAIEPEATSLQGLQIGFRVRWPSFRVFCDELDVQLTSRFGTSEHSLWWDLDTDEGNPRIGSSPTSDFKPRARELLTTILGSDVAIFGLAACGSCSEEAVTDFAAAYHEGQPAILVCTDRFVDLCRIRAAALGVEGTFPLVVLPHPFETLDRGVIRSIAGERAAEFAAAIASLARRSELSNVGADS